MSKISQMTVAGTLVGTEQTEVSQLSTTVTITAATLSAQASDQSFNDSGTGFVTAGFAVGQTVKVTGFTGNVANNIFSATITTLTAGKMTIGGADGNVIVDDAAGESVTITKWNTRRVDYATFANATQGRRALWVPAAQIQPSATGGCAALAVVAMAANQPDLHTLNFDQTAQEYAQFFLSLPNSWNEGTITFVPIWSHPAATVYQVIWDLQAIAMGDGDTFITNYGTAQTSTDTGGTTDDVYLGPESAAITVAGSPVAGDLIAFRLSRVAGSDTLDSDARLHGITIYYTTNANTDA